MTTSLPSPESCTSTSAASAFCCQARRMADKVFSGASCDAPRWAMICMVGFAAKERKERKREFLRALPSVGRDVLTGRLFLAGSSEVKFLMQNAACPSDSSVTAQVRWSPRLRPLRSLRSLRQRNLFRQPLLPILRELVHIRLGDRDQFADILDLRRLFLEMDAIDEVFDRPIAPLIDLLSQEDLHVTAAQVGQLRRKGIDRDALHRAGLPLESIIGEH